MLLWLKIKLLTLLFKQCTIYSKAVIMFLCLIVTIRYLLAHFLIADLHKKRNKVNIHLMVECFEPAQNMHLKNRKICLSNTDQLYGRKSSKVNINLHDLFAVWDNDFIKIYTVLMHYSCFIFSTHCKCLESSFITKQTYINILDKKYMMSVIMSDIIISWPSSFSIARSALFYFHHF